MNMNTLELFSGAGGLAKGLELSGFRHSALIEINKYACESLRENFDPTKVFLGDIRDFDLHSAQNIDLVAGGPPCQPFSLGGKHRADRDDRDMFPHAIQAIDHLQPKAFIFENVKGILRQSFADYFQYIILRLTYPSHRPKTISDWLQHLYDLRSLNYSTYPDIKYQVQYQLLNAANYGVPQSRDRVFIIGIRDNLSHDWSFPPSTHSLDRLLWDMHITKVYWERHQISKTDRPTLEESTIAKITKLKKMYGSIGPQSLPLQTVRDAIQHLPDPRSDHYICDHLFRSGARIYPGHTGSILDLPSKTIKAGDHGVPGGENMIRFPNDSVRYLTVLEAKLLQTFPADFVIKGVWSEAMRQIGNAVPVALAEILGREIVKTLESGLLNVQLTPTLPTKRITANSNLIPTATRQQKENLKVHTKLS
jgi:DNA (cytosine-5)-methyltransferase 1